MNYLTKIFFWGYLSVFALAGLFGMIAAPWEIQHEMMVQTELLYGDSYINLVHQVRFLRATELGFAILCIYLSGLILKNRRLSFVFAVTAGIVTLARGISLAVEGQPGMLFILSLIGEGATAVLMYLHSRRLSS